jgi:hypothetical protein
MEIAKSNVATSLVLTFRRVPCINCGETGRMRSKHEPGHYEDCPKCDGAGYNDRLARCGLCRYWRGADDATANARSNGIGRCANLDRETTYRWSCQNFEENPSATYPKEHKEVAKVVSAN